MRTEADLGTGSAWHLASPSGWGRALVRRRSEPGNWSRAWMSSSVSVRENREMTACPVSLELPRSKEAPEVASVMPSELTL